MYRFDVGYLRTFYIKTEEGYPLLAIGLYKINGQWKNAPSYVNDPLMQAVSELANHYYAMPDQYPLSNLRPNVNTQIQYDSLFTNPEVINPVSFNFNSYKVNYDAETGLILPADDEALAGMLSFYKKFKNNDTASYFGAFTLSSRARAYESLNGITKKDFEYYKKLKLSFNRVGYILALGKVNILFFRNSATTPENGNIVKTYVFNQDGFAISNEFMEFYLDDLMKQPKFSNQLNK